MYSKIHQLKAEKLNKAQTARRMGVNIKTVMKYWDMPPEDFARYQQLNRRRCHKLDIYKAQILARLQEYPDFSSAQIHDWLKETYPGKEFRERTVRRYVEHLRKKYHIPKTNVIRQCEAVDELPPGQQLQVDFGEITVPTSSGSHRKLYCMAEQLAYSRYK